MFLNEKTKFTCEKFKRIDIKKKRKLKNQLINFNSLFINEDKHIGEIEYKTVLVEKNLKHFFY